VCVCLSASAYTPQKNVCVCVRAYVVLCPAARPYPDNPTPLGVMCVHTRVCSLERVTSYKGVNMRVLVFACERACTTRVCEYMCACHHLAPNAAASLTLTILRTLVLCTHVRACVFL